MPVIFISFITSTIAVLNLELVVVFIISSLSLNFFLTESNLQFSASQQLILYLSLCSVPIAIIASLLFAKQLFSQNLQLSDLPENQRPQFLPQSAQMFVYFLGLVYAFSSSRFQDCIEQALHLDESTTIATLLSIVMLKINHLAMVVTVSVLCIYILQFAFELPLLILNRITGYHSFLNPKHLRIVIFILVLSLTFDSLAGFYQELG